MIHDNTTLSQNAAALQEAQNSYDVSYNNVDSALQATQVTPVQPESTTETSSWFAFTDPSYLKGFLVAAGVTAVAANPNIRQAIVKGAVKTWTKLQGGVEELKEQVQDVRAEMSENKG